jgi:hypothetical protein
MDHELDTAISRWRSTLDAAAGLPAEDAQELEDHLRDEVESLRGLGLTVDEAMLVAVKRLGNVSEVVQRLAVIDADLAWRQTFESPPPSAPKAGTDARETAFVLTAALVAALLGKLPRLFGVSLDDAGMEIYLRNIGLFVIPVLILVYYLRRRFAPAMLAGIAVVVAASAIAANAYPFAPGAATSFLVALHLPLMLWLLLGLAYAGDDWRTVRRPLDFIRFTGEAFLYGVLILCGGVVFVGLVIAFFAAIDIDIALVAAEYLGLSILLATPVIAAYLVESKRSLIENLAPVLARIFIPLFLVMMVAFIVAVGVQGIDTLASREILILIDVLLLLVVGMVLYDLSARRDTQSGFGWPHKLNLALIVAAMIIDLLALYGIGSRLLEYGFSPNKAAALGENVFLLINLGGLALAYGKVAAGRATFERVLAWQVRYLPVYLLWFAVVVFAFPPLFGYR